MIINSDYLKHEEENVRNVAIETCSYPKDIRKGEQCCITTVNQRSPIFRVLPANTIPNRNVIQRRKLSHESLKRDSYIFRIIELALNESDYYNSAWTRRGVGA